MEGKVMDFKAAKDECNNGGAGAVHGLAGIHPNGGKHTQNPCFSPSHSAVTLPTVVAEKQHFSPRFQHLQHQKSHASSSVYPPSVGSPVRGEGFSKRELRRFGNIELSPSAGVLNYGQGLFEGLKAYRKHDGNILLFRPEENAMRLQMGADRLCMPCPTVDQFVEAVKDTVLANERWIPPLGKGSLYVRPLLMGSGAVLGVAPAPEYTFLIYVSPVGNYFKEGLAPINLIVENEMHRATPGGTGGVKAIGNYSAVLKAHSAAKAKGYSDVLYLDSVHKRYLEEVSTCNVFVVKGNVISTPAVEGTILPGITRKSIVDVARSQGFKVEERLVAVDELLEADEVFCTGTAVVVSPVGSITYLNKKVTYGINGVGPVSQQVYYALTSLQMGLAEDKMGWTVELKVMQGLCMDFVDSL